MNSKILKKEGDNLTLQFEVPLDATSMLNSEQQIAKALNEVGLLASKEALAQFDTDGSPIKINDVIYTSKGMQKKSINFRMDK